MKYLALLSLCLMEIFSTASPKCTYPEKENSTMVYATGKKVFLTEFEGLNVTKESIEFKSQVTGFTLYNDHLYGLVKRSDKNHRDSEIWRFKLQKNSTSFKIDNSTKETFHVVNSADADLLCMVIVRGYIYSGRSDGKIWKCSADKKHSCEDFHTFEGNPDYQREIGEIEFNPKDRNIYAVKSVKPGEIWYHQLWRCSQDVIQSCYKLPAAPLKGWASLHVAFDAFWIADAGVIRKCPFSWMIRYDGVDYERCMEFEDFDQSIDMNIAASSNYLYVRLVNGRYIWRCDPKDVNSCFKAVRFSEVKSMGPFMIV